MRRLGQPGVVGELLGGFIVGPYGLGLVQPGETALVFAEMGVVVLLFSVGLEVRTDDLLKVGKPAILTAIIAMILPIIGGFGAHHRPGRDHDGVVLRRPRAGRHQHRHHEPRAAGHGCARPHLREGGDRGGARRRHPRARPDRARGRCGRGRPVGQHAPGGRRRHRAGPAGVRRGAPRSRPQVRGLHLAAVRRHPARARVPDHARRRAAFRGDGPGGHHRGVRGGPDRGRDRGRRRDRARHQAARPDLHAVLLRGDRCADGPLGAPGPEGRRDRGPAGADRHRDQGRRRVHRRLLDRALGGHDRRLRDGAARRGRDRGREPRPGDRRGRRGPVRRDAGRGGADDRRRAVPAGLGRAQGEAETARAEGPAASGATPVT